MSPEQQGPGEDVGETLKYDDRFVLGEISDEKHDDEDGQVRVGPHWVNIMVNLNKVFLVWLGQPQESCR